MLPSLRRCLAGVALAAMVPLPLRAVGVDPLLEFTHRVWHVQDGLPDQVVQAIAQTPNHYLWVGTTKGLLRFDGRNFVPFLGNHLAALQHGVTCLLPARDGSLYIGTEGGGLLRLDGGTMQQFTADFGIGNPLIRSILQDSSGELWVGTDRGLFRAAGGRFVRVEGPQVYQNLGSAALVQDHAGNIWSGGSRLLRIGDGGLREYVLPEQNGSMRIKALSMTSDGSIWAGAVAGLFRQLPNGEFAKVSEVHGSVRTLGVMTDGRLWIGTVGQGLYVQRGSTFDHITAPGVLPSNTILSQAADHDGNLWLGTQSGMLRLSRSGMRLAEMPDAMDSDFGTLMRDADGSLWICSSQLFHMQGGQPRRYRFPGLGSITVRTMLRERGGALWLGTSGQGAYRIAPDGPVAHSTTEIGTNYIRGFLQSSDGSVWIGTDGGVSRYRNGSISDYHEIPHAPHTLTLSMAEAPDGRLWIGTPRGLITIKDGIYEEPFAARGIRDESIWALHTEQDGTVWVGSDSGLHRLRNGVLTHIPLGSEPTIPAVYQILEDARGTMWIAEPTRVLLVQRSMLESAINDPSEPGISPRIFSVTAEIQAAELYGGMQPGGVLEADGTAWFSTSQGPLHLIPRQKPALGDVPLAIGDVLVDGRSVNQTAGLDLPAGTRTLEINYAPVLLSSQMGLGFRHRLEGFEDWSPVSHARTATYTNLPAGHYRFRVELLSGENPQASSVEMPVLQRSFFYRRPWFWGLCLMPVLALVWLMHRQRLRQIQIRYRTIASERNRLAREMHDTVIQGCTAVSALLEAHSSVGAASGVPLLQLAREQIRTTIDDARTAVWNLRSSVSDGHEFGPSLRRLLERTVPNGAMIPTFYTEGAEPTLDYAVAHELLMSTREALLNAVAHSAGTRIDLKLRWSANGLTLTVADDGTGFCVEQATADADLHYGLTGMRERIESIGGTIELVSRIGEGTQLVFKVPRSVLDHRTDSELEVTL